MSIGPGSKKTWVHRAELDMILVLCETYDIVKEMSILTVFVIICFMRSMDNNRILHTLKS